MYNKTSRYEDKSCKLSVITRGLMNRSLGVIMANDVSSFLVMYVRVYVRACVRTYVRAHTQLRSSSR